MQKFTTLTGIAAYLPMINVDTDMIIPKQYLKTIKRTGLGKGLFAELRYDEAGKPREDFVLHKPPYHQAKILITGENFGCGSSREHAPWALLDFGISCIIAPSFADIFYNNCFKNGILPIALPQEEIDKLIDDAARGANAAHPRRSSQSGDQRARRRQDPFRHRPLPQALPDGRARRYRAHPGEGRRHRGLRRQGTHRASLGLTLVQARRSPLVSRKKRSISPEASGPSASV